MIYNQLLYNYNPSIMGVPVFFKWLCMRNPKILRDALECSQEDIDSANPYIDNFYVDMNGLIHPSCNPKGEAIREPKNFQQQCENIYEYIDKIINIVRPRKLLYLAIDGVAPRAKMNQQRSRRFRAAMQGLQILSKKQELLEEFKKKNIDTSDIEAYVNKTSFDSNLITPGTNFLCDVATAIRDYIKKRLATHRHWKHLTVIFSDASCPGEGEHKIMEFIRQQRASASYDPNQTHCIYGADADLIMLGLAAHQPRFFIIRQVVVTATEKFCTSCNKKGHYFIDCRPAQSIEDEQRVQNVRNAESINVQFQFLNLKLVRQFLHLHFMKAKDPSQYDLERVIDDFIFLCFFVGNDFLPHIPILTIREGGIDILLKVYEYTLGVVDGYLTNAGQLDLKNLKFFINEMKQYQRDVVDEIIRKEEQSKLREQNQKMLKGERKQEQLLVDWSQPLNSFKNEIKKLTNPENNLENYSIFSHNVFNYKEKYYRQKFRIEPKQFLQLKHFISTAYIQALQWICYYYYRGVPSWSWFYSFHYSPFFTDIDVEDLPIFELGQPFKPFQQLVAVLPPKTSHALPDVLKPLLLDIRSPIADYFPSEFEIDLVGKKFAWLGQVLLPFIDDKRLLKAMGNYQRSLNQQQLSRNKLGHDFVYVNKTYGPLGRKLQYSSQRTLEARYGEYKIEGRFQLLGCQGDVTQWRFDQPSGRKHEVKLKEGIQFTALEQLNDDFFRRIDRKSYGGQRFVRIIERSLGQRIHFLRNGQNRKDYRSRDRTQRSRSRDNERYRHRDDPSLNRRQSGDRRGNRDYSGNRGQDHRGSNSRDNRDNRDNRDSRDYRRDNRERDTR